MDLSAQRELGSLRDEVDDMSNLIVQIQNRLVDTTRCWEADTKSWNARIQALEEQNAILTAANESLRTRNSELEGKTQSQGFEAQPHNLIKERDIALCKLEHARQVIRDLVDEKVNTSLHVFGR
ncbi:hypothetical protein BD779DRAFT_398496 [Infundibulicybe gibba]|nr:hypothetical protein BD779DRAFT_398496 [Infundibulicybe gibba]